MNKCEVKALQPSYHPLMNEAGIDKTNKKYDFLSKKIFHVNNSNDIR
jgi:hypothetical protein